MAYSAYMDRGYDLSLFETSGTSAKAVAPQKQKKKQRTDNIVTLPHITYSKENRRKHNIGSLIVGFTMATVIALVVGIIIHGQVQLAELNQNIATAQSELEYSKSYYVQMQAKVESSLSTAAIEEYARTELGMSKATNQQKEYISLSGGDKAEIYTKSNNTVFTEMGEFFGSLWS